MNALTWSEAAAWVCGLGILVCCAVVLIPKRKPRGLARPVRDSRSSLEIFRRMGSQR